MNFNTRIAAYFLKNTRLTALLLFLVLLMGGVSTWLLKTTGFPNPDVGFVLVQTFYFGASSSTVASEVTGPLELAIRDVDGIASFSSSSSNSISIISISLKDGVNTETALGKIDTALQSVSLPEGADAPELSVPDIGGPDFLFSLISEDSGQLYADYRQLEEELRALPETAAVDPMVKLEKRVLITLNETRMEKFGVSRAQVQAALASIGESFPVVSDVPLSGENKSIIVSVSTNDFKDLEDLSFGDVQLKDFASVDLDYSFDKDQSSQVAYNVEGDAFAFSALNFQVKTVEGTDLSAYMESLQKIFETVDDIKVVQDFDFKAGFDGTLLVMDYSVDDQNQQQVDEVVSGLIGAPLNTDAPWSYAGWLLGGIQLVFLVMLFFVSWRAAVIAALAIPLSLVFSNIYLYLAGENLNTLVLFSLVLAIGLVVDPALVLLESVQRKVDLGLNGKEAALAAVQDVGMGLFLACLTSAIVFIPFGVVSGVLGQIITYIPATVIPAVVGSYVVPLVFLAWIGGNFLKRRSGKTTDEEHNLWAISRAMIRVNEWLLTGSRFLRFVIIVLAMVIPVLVSGYYFSTGKVKSVQFASDDNSDYMQLSFSYYPTTPQIQRDELLRGVLETVAQNDNVLAVFPLQGSQTYFIQLFSIKDGREDRSTDIADSINKALNEDFEGKFFDLKVGVISNGPPKGDYQVTLAVSSTDLVQLKKDAEQVAADLLDMEEVSKVDDGFTGQETEEIEVLIDRKKLAEKQLVVPGAPLSSLVYSALRDLFSVNGGNPVGHIEVDGERLDIVLDKKTKDPQNLNAVRALEITSLAGQTVKLSDVASIRTVESPGSISRLNGKTIAVVKARLVPDKQDEASAATVSQALLDYEAEHHPDLSVELYSEGDTAGFVKSFTQLFTALLLAIVITYIVLVVFFESFTQPLVILFAIPLTFVGVFPALAELGNGQFGFLEIIGLIILVGIVENVAIFLIDAAKQKIHEGWDDVRAISYASGVRLRAVLLTKLTAIASLAPLAFLSPEYRSLSLVIIFGLLTSGITSLFTTPILFIFFRWLSRKLK